MKTNNKISAYILRGSTAALLFSCVIVALCSAINLPEQPLKALPPQDNAAFDVNADQSRTLSFADRVAYQRAIEDVYWRHRIWPKERRPQAIAGCGDISGAAGKESRRLSAQLTGAGGLLATADYCGAIASRDGAHGQHTKQPEVLRELFEALGTIPLSSRSVWPDQY